MRCDQPGGLSAGLLLLGIIILALVASELRAPFAAARSPDIAIEAAQATPAPSRGSL